MPRRPVFAMLAFNAAVLLAMLAALGSVTTYVPEIQRAALSWSCGHAVASVVLVASAWRRLPCGTRWLGVGVIAFAALGGAYSASRLMA